MRDRLRIEGWLSDIAGWGERAGRRIDGKGYEFFVQDELTQDAVMKCLENIGEAAGNILRIERGFERLHPRLALSSAYGARNRIARGYETVNPEVVWATVSNSVPAIVAAAWEVLGGRRESQ